MSQKLYLGTNFIKSYNLAPQLFPPMLVDEISRPSESEDSKKHKLSVIEEYELKKIIELFPSSENSLGLTSLEEHVIDTGDSPPIKAKTYPHSPAIQKLIEVELDRLLDLGIIEPSQSSWRSPITLVCKPGKNRLCLDSRKLNKVTKPLAYPIPHMDGLLSRLKDTNYISSIDLKDAFFQVPLHKDSREKTAFAVPASHLPYIILRSCPLGFVMPLSG